MSNSIAPGSSANINVKVTALTTNQNVPVTYKTIILKKNLVNGVNTLTQEMMSIQNTKYVIKYDYILGEDVTIPANCILELDGGSIIGNGTSKDTIIGNNTIIVGNKNTFSNVTFTGIFDNNQVFVSWFVENTDKSLVNAMTLGKTIILDKDITFTQDVSLTKNDTTIKSNHYTITEGLFSLSFDSVSNVTIEGINFYGTTTNQDNVNNALAFNGASNCTIKDCVLDGCYSYGFIFQNSTKCSIESCEFKQTGAVVRNMLSYGKSCDYLTISNNKFKNIGFVYAVRIDLCTNSYIINNSFVNVDNNPILVNTGCSYCTVSGNYIDTNQDSGIIISNDPVYISDGQGGETVTRETAHHITITKNHIRNSKDTGIGLYNYSASTNGFIHHVTIEDNICEDNGLNSVTSNFRSQIFVSARNFIIIGNILRCTQKQSDVSGVFIQDTYEKELVNIIENGEDIKIFNNLCENVVPFGQNHYDVAGGSINIKTDIGISRELDLNFYVKSEDSNFPKSEIGKFTWDNIAGAYPIYPSIDIDNKILSIHTSTPISSAAMRCTFEDNSLFINPCLFIITGLVKVSNKNCGTCSVVIRTIMETRVREEFDNTDYIPFYYSVLCHKDVPKVEIGAPKYLNEGTAYYKDVKFELRYL